MCCGSVRDWPPSRLCPPDRPASFPARRPQPAVWRCASPGCVLGVAGRHAAPAGPALSGVLQAQDALTTAGFCPPSWEELLDNPTPPSSLNLSGHLPEPSARAWQAPAATAIAEQLQAALLPQLDAASQALLFSQTGPFSSRPFCSAPSCPELTFPSDHLRALLLRRLRLPLPLSARSCRCRRPLDPLGDHRAACARSGALRSRGPCHL